MSALLLLAAPLVVGCGDSSKESRDANTSDVVTALDTGTTPDGTGDTAALSDATPALPDASGDLSPSLDTPPAQPDVTVDAPAGDAPTDRPAVDTGSLETGATG